MLMSEGLRQHPRSQFLGDVYVMDNDGFGFVLEAVNVSRGGVFLKTPYLLEAGERCFVRFKLPDGAWISAAGHVSRTQEDIHPACPTGMAIAFDDFFDDSHDNLAERV